MNEYRITVKPEPEGRYTITLQVRKRKWITLGETFYAKHEHVAAAVKGFSESLLYHGGFYK